MGKNEDGKMRVKGWELRTSFPPKPKSFMSVSHKEMLIDGILIGNLSQSDDMHGSCQR